MAVGSVCDIEVESELVEQARRGDLRACDRLVTLHRTRAVRIARSFVRDRDVAEDIAQDAFVRAFVSIHDLKSTGSFTSYLTRIIVRLCIDRSRKSSADEVVLDLEPPAWDLDKAPEEVWYVHSILEKLSCKLREVIVLRDVEGMDYASIAEALTIPIGTVRSRLSAARAVFKELYISGCAEEESQDEM